MLVPDNPKQKQAILFDPQKEREAKRKRQMAELLIQQGNAPHRNEVAGGMTVKRSPWENINQAAQKFKGEYDLAKSDNQVAEAEKRRQEMIVEALSNPDQMSAVKVLAQDPNTSDAAIRMYSDVLGDQRRMEQLRVMAQVRASTGGGSIPAPMQIANQMFALEQAARDPNATQEQRILAERQYNLLGQAAKTYGFDRGFSADLGIMQPQDMLQGANNQSFGPQQPLDPMQEHQHAVMQQQMQTGVSPMQRPGLSAPTVSSIGGYDQAMAQRQAGIKAAETSAASDAKYMSEGRQMLPKAQRALQDSQLRGENISRVADQVADTAQKAFTTGFTGSISSAVPGTAAHDLKMNLQTLEATAAFDTLQNMRNNSPTGGALGAISERELDLLKAAYTNLSNSQNYEQFMSNLAAFNRQNTQSLQNMAMAYDQDYQRFGGQQDRFLPSPSTMQRAQPIAQPPQGGREQIIQQLRDSGIPEERIQQYLQAKGL